MSITTGANGQRADVALRTSYVHLTLKSRNKKVGSIPVSTSSAATCPDACPLKSKGCYAASGPMSLHWHKVTDGKAGASWDTFTAQIAALPEGQAWRHNQAGDLPVLVAQRGVDVEVWNRRVVGAHRASPWPSAAPWQVALLRLPKAKDEQEMAAHTCLAALVDGGRLVVYGGNDEGIRSAAGMLEELCGSVDTLADAETLLRENAAWSDSQPGRTT
jgi:hypothetical protein